MSEAPCKGWWSDLGLHSRAAVAPSALTPSRHLPPFVRVRSGRLLIILLDPPRHPTRLLHHLRPSATSYLKVASDYRGTSLTRTPTLQ